MTSKKLLDCLIAALIALALFCALPMTAPAEEPRADFAAGEEAPLPPPPPGEPPEFMHGHGRMRMAAEVRKFFDDLKERDPAEYERLMRLRVEDRRKFMDEVAKRLPRPQHDGERKIFELDRECWQIARKLRQATDETEKASLRKSLEERTGETLDLIVAQTREQLEETSERLRVIQENREKILEKKLNFFLRAPLPPDMPPQ